MVQGRWWDQSIGGGVRRGMGWSELREEGTELRLMGRQQLHMAGGAVWLVWPWLNQLSRKPLSACIDYTAVLRLFAQAKSSAAGIA